MSKDDDIKELEEILKNLACNDWEKFKEVFSIDMEQLYLCELKFNKDLSYRQISQKTNIPKSTIEYKCKRCPKF